MNTLSPDSIRQGPAALTHVAVGTERCAATLEKKPSLVVSHNVKHRYSPYDQSNSTEVYTSEMKTYVHTKPSTQCL